MAHQGMFTRVPSDMNLVAPPSDTIHDVEQPDSDDTIVEERQPTPDLAQRFSRQEEWLDSVHQAEEEQDEEQPEPSNRLPPAPTFQDREALHDLEDLIDKESRNATFTCGGRIPIILHPNVDDAGSLTPRTKSNVLEQRATTKPITIRWGPDGSGRQISFPSTDPSALQSLLAACTPATFGRNGRDVYDPSYRLAGSLKASDFSTSLCPYELGIMDLVTQLLVPSIVPDLQPPEAIPFRVEVTRSEKIRIADVFQHFTIPDFYPSAIRHTDVPAALARLGFPMPESSSFAKTLLSAAPGSVAWFAEFRDLAEERILEAKAERERTWKPKLDQRMWKRGLRAELYKLNVYSAPGGKFEEHWDTPRGEGMVGCLVVCLPVDFEGGTLTVRHNSQEIQHDWSPSSSTYIQWTAFYSDCAHSIGPVTSGHRLTLTYNLFLSRSASLLNTLSSSLSPPTLPLALQLHRLLSDPHFLLHGGLLAMHCNHAYPHTSPCLSFFVPDMLKGADMSLYHSLISANLHPTLFPYPLTNATYTDLLTALNQPPSPSPSSFPPRRSVLKPLTLHPEPQEDGEGSEVESDYVDESSASDDDGVEGGIKRDYMLEDHGEGYVKTWERKRFMSRVLWLGGRGQEELGRVWMAYGNEAEMRWKYTSLAMMVRVPAWEERMNGNGE